MCQWWPVRFWRASSGSSASGVLPPRPAGWPGSPAARGDEKREVGPSGLSDVPSSSGLPRLVRNGGRVNLSRGGSPRYPCGSSASWHLGMSYRDALENLGVSLGARSAGGYIPTYIPIKFRRGGYP
jgi:hypothetical protein